MSENALRYPKLDFYYQQYLTDENSATFIQGVSANYNIGSLERLATAGHRISRRASILALGFLGDFSCNEVMGRALVDQDRGVRMLADHGSREIWARQGTSSEQEVIHKLYRLIELSQMDEAIDAATDLLRSNPAIGEAWSQRAIAHCHQGYLEAAIEDCKEALNCNRFHFPAALGLAHCCLQVNDRSAALHSFRVALKINPDLDGVRQQVSHLERIIED
jgi:tetratricopeptide (TPR) repeat protein